MMKLRSSKYLLVAAYNIGHYLYCIAERYNFQDWVKKV